jgi:hypothetical protein
MIRALLACNQLVDATVNESSMTLTRQIAVMNPKGTVQWLSLALSSLGSA